MADTILRNGRITTLDPTRPQATALAIKDTLFAAVGEEGDVMALKGEGTKVIDLGGRRVVPGLNDSHTHVIRGGLHYNMELRWEGVPSLADALRMLKEQAARTPAPQGVRVVGGWAEFQFAERRWPTLEEINAVAPDTPVFILHLYSHALLNAAALRAVGYTKDTPDTPGGAIERDKAGNPTGMLIARPSALILYSTLAKGPVLPFDDQVNSSRQFHMRALIVAKGCSTVSRRWRMAFGFSSSRRCTASRTCSCSQRVIRRCWAGVQSLLIGQLGQAFVQ
jgi:predicted amidohydrolase YtcJ